MHRFFLPPEAFNQSPIQLPEETARQVALVLRLKSGQNVILLDNTGYEYLCELENILPGHVTAQILARSAVFTEPPLDIHLYLSLTQREKFELALQKCTEVGVSGFTPLLTARSLVQGQENTRSKHTRWQRIIQEAAEQSGRGMIPLLYPSLRYGEALAQAKKQSGSALIAWEGEKSRTLEACLVERPAEKIALFIGPEGGFTPGEVELAVKAGIQPFTLGPRILRMETAAIVAAALVVHLSSAGGATGP